MPRQAQNSRINLTFVKLLLLLLCIEVKAQAGHLDDDEGKKTLLLSFSRFYSITIYKIISLINHSFNYYNKFNIFES